MTSEQSADAHRRRPQEDPLTGTKEEQCAHGFSPYPSRCLASPSPERALAAEGEGGNQGLLCVS